MASLLFFNIACILMLGVMAYVFWRGVGRKRRELGRGFGLICAAMAAYLAWETFEILT